MTPDVINGSFEVIGGLCLWWNVRTLWRDRLVKGVDWRVTAFFQSWGAWNLYYYPSLNQPFSFFGGLVIFAANSAWLALAWRFR